MSGYLNVYDLIEGHAHSSQQIISFYDDYHLVCQKSFSDIHQDVVATAKKLSAQLARNEIFFVSLPNAYDFLVLFLASLRAGVIPAPIVSPDLMAKSDYFDYLNEIKTYTQIQKILAPENYRLDLVKSGFEVVSLATVSTAVADRSMQQFVNNPQKPKFLSPLWQDQIAFIQFSSGSTSEPKGVLISHKALIENINSIKQALNLNESSVILSGAPLFHDMGLVGTLLTPLLTPFAAHILKPIDFFKSPAKFIELTAKLQATVWVGPDSMYRILAKSLQQDKFSSPLDLSSLQVCLCGSEPVLYETFIRFSEAATPYGWKPTTFVPGYGQSENVLAISFTALNSQIKIQKKNKRDVVSCGRPIGDTKIQILDENQKLVKDGTEGLIWFQSSSLCSGYLDQEDLFKTNKLGSWFFTGDIGFIKDEEIYISGRFKDMIIIDSKRYFAVDLEQRVWNIIGHDKHVKKIAIVGSGAIGGDEAVSICIEWLDFMPLFSFRQRQEFSNKIIHNLKNQFKINKKDIFYTGIGSLPRTTSGKLKRYLIRTKITQGQLKSSLWHIFWRSWVFFHTRF